MMDLNIYQFVVEHLCLQERTHFFVCHPFLKVVLKWPYFRRHWIPHRLFVFWLKNALRLRKNKEKKISKYFKWLAITRTPPPFPSLPVGSPFLPPSWFPFSPSLLVPLFSFSLSCPFHLSPSLSPAPFIFLLLSLPPPSLTALMQICVSFKRNIVINR